MTDTTDTIITIPDHPAEAAPGFAPEHPTGRDGLETARVDQIAPVIPGVLDCDLSWSMHDDLQTLIAATGRLVDGLRTHPLTAEMTHLGLVGFADTAQVLSTLRPTHELAGDLPQLQCFGNGTNFGAAFDATADLLDSDLPRLDALAPTIYRPTVFFLTDGEHNQGDWRAAYERLTNPERRFRPNIIAFGFRNADPDDIATIATVPDGAYFAAHGADPADVIDSIIKIITKSMIALTQSATTGQATALPAPDHNLITIDPV